MTLSAIEMNAPIVSDACESYTGPIEVVMPFYERDICFVRLFARGIRRYMDKNTFRAIHFVWVSTLPLPKSELDEITLNLGASEVVVTVSTMPLQDQRQGWNKQQEAKLNAAFDVATPYYVAFDTKNIPISSFGREIFFAPDNKARSAGYSTLDELTLPDRGWLEKSNLLVAENRVPGHARVGKCHTPFMFHTETTRRLVRLVNSKYGTLANAINRGASEFAMYDIYIRDPHQTRSLDCHHSLMIERSRSAKVVWRNTPNAVDVMHDISNQIAEGKNFDFSFFGVHRLWTRRDSKHVAPLAREIFIQRKILGEDEQWFSKEMCEAAGKSAVESKVEGSKSGTENYDDELIDPESDWFGEWMPSFPELKDMS